MPRAATSDELTLLRSDGQAAKLYAAFFIPHTIYSAVLSAVPSTTDMVAEVSFGSGSGTLANVKPDMLLKVGSTVGGQELGIARIRKAPIAGTFYIGEQSIINWGAVSPVYLTVTDDYDLWAKHVRIDGTTIYMDYDIAFSDQHTVFSPVPVLGPVVAVGKLEGANVIVQLGPETGYQSWVIGSSISTYLWSCATAVSFSSTSAVRPTATFDTIGWHVVYCTVTAANGKTRQGVRYVYIYDDDNPPLAVLQIGEFVEDNKQGGINFSLSFADQASLAEIPDRALCVLFAEDYYSVGDDQEKTSIGAVSGRENIVGIGRVIAESLSYDDESQTAQIEIQGYQELMKRIHGFPAGLRFKVTPEVWTDMPSMTVDRALYHLWEYHTTAITIMDFNRTGDTRLTAQAFSPFSSIWEQAREFAWRQIFASINVDHLGRLWCEIDALFLPVASRTYPVVMTLQDSDLTGRVDLPREVLSDVGQVNLSGVAVDGGGNASAFFSLSPGHIHDRTGRVEVADRLLLADQTQANQLAGLLFAAKNNPYKPMRIKTRANNRLVTCFPNQAVTYTISAANNPRGFAITKNWIPRQRKLSYDPETGALSVELVIEAETIPMHAVVGDVPGSNDFTFPPLPGLPSLPSLPVILPGGFGGGTPSDNGPKSVLVHSPNIGLVMTDNFDTSSPDWFTINSGLTTVQYQSITNVFVTPSGALYAVSARHYNPGSSSYPFVARAPYAGGTFEIIEDHDSIAARLGLSDPFNVRISQAGYNALLSDTVMWTVGLFAAACKIVLCEGGTPATKIDIDHNATGGSLSYGGGAWLLTGGRMGGAVAALKVSTDGGTVLANELIPDAGITRIAHVRISTTGDTYHWPGPSEYLVKGTNNAASFETNIGSGITTFLPLAIDPTGQYMMTVIGTLTGKAKSADGGSTWVAIPDLPFVGNNWNFCYAGDSGSDSRWIAVYSYIRYSPDFGATWEDKQGNFPDLDPTYAVRLPTVLEF